MRRLDPMVGDPCLDFGGVEAEEVAPFDVGDAALGDETTDVSAG